MTVLRSREIVPKVKSQSPSKTLKMETNEPTTPAKTLEPSNHESYTTPISMASAQTTSPLGLGSDSVSLTETVRRRSFRLASSRSVDEMSPSLTVSNWKTESVVAENLVQCENARVGVGEINSSVSVSNRKRKSAVTENFVKCGNDYVGVSEIGSSVAVETSVKCENEFVGVHEINVSDSRQKKVRACSEISRRVGSDTKGCEKECLGSVWIDEIQVSGSGEKKVRVSDRIGVKKGRKEAVSVADEVTTEGVGNEVGQVSGRAVNDKKWKKKGIWGDGVDLRACELARKDSRDKGFLNLRSGKKIGKRKMEGSLGDVGLVGIESGNGALMSMPEPCPGGEGIGTLRGRIDTAETVKLGVGSKVLEKDQTIGENGFGIKSRRRLSREEKGKGKAVDNNLASTDNTTADSPENVGLKGLERGPTADGNRAARARKRLSWEEKGKGKMVEDSLVLSGIAAVDLEVKPDVADSTKNAVSGTPSVTDGGSVQEGWQVMETTTRANANRVRDHRERFRDIARQNASRFAHFPSQEEEENHVTEEAEREMPGGEADGEVEDWPGPFSTAMKIIKDRAMNVNVLQQNSNLCKSKPPSVTWVPRKDRDLDCSKVSIPSLQDLSLVILAKNADAITSLDTVPDILRHKLSQLLCDTRRMNSHFLDLLVQGSPTEIRIRDCSWLTEEQFTNSFEGCETTNLTVLQLDLCGCCMPDYVLGATLASSSNSLPALTTISLKGSYRLSDVGLRSLVASAPALKTINLNQCSLITSDGINTLADSLGSVLRELYISDCQNIDALLILPALLNLEHLEVLSLAGIETVCDDFLRKFIAVRGHHIKELILTDCAKLTDSSLKVIADNCTRLCALDLGNLRRLTDSAMGYLANGCRAIETLKLCRNPFSDEAVAAYVEASGESLKELSLNNVIKVGHNTALSIARCSRKLFSLDLSWCRNLTDEALGLIVDSCLSLKLLKLFGCTQITNVFLDGHSNPHVLIIGLKATGILEHLKVPDPPEGALHYSSASS